MSDATVCRISYSDSAGSVRRVDRRADFRRKHEVSPTRVRRPVRADSEAALGLLLAVSAQRCHQHFGHLDIASVAGLRRPDAQWASTVGALDRVVDRDRAVPEVDLRPTQSVRLAGPRTDAQHGDEVSARGRRREGAVTGRGQRDHQGRVLLPGERFFRPRLAVDRWCVGVRRRPVLRQLGEARRVPCDVPTGDRPLEHFAEHLLVVPTRDARLRLASLATGFRLDAQPPLDLGDGSAGRAGARRSGQPR